MTLVGRDKSGYFRKVSGQQGNTDADLRAEFERGKTLMGSMVVALFRNDKDAREYLKLKGF